MERGQTGSVEVVRVDLLEEDWGVVVARFDDVIQQ